MGLKAYVNKNIKQCLISKKSYMGSQVCSITFSIHKLPMPFISIISLAPSMIHLVKVIDML